MRGSDYSITVIIPTLNEAKYLDRALRALEKQTNKPFEVVCFDGGSNDNTLEIAERHNTIVRVEDGLDELSSRNLAAKMSSGELLLFTSADVILPRNTLKHIQLKFRSKPDLIALTGRPVPFESPLLCRLEYHIWNQLKLLFSVLPGPLKQFISSSSFLVVRREYFERTGGFDPNYVNGDGILGKRLTELGDTDYCIDIPYLISARRYNHLGFLGFNKQFSYVVENLFPVLSKLTWLDNFRRQLKKYHTTLE